ncbi:phenylalanine--tRNA ligase subunit beta [Mycoplasmopsis cricetuli]|uniref:phenylalanine--tRNA ligase subunit beta n=1 Tax=Mycoplasmopsis cricetuli TaxID=171283 RepID=UPI0004711814|nr:phenylalanine--tRNA ligase subunit beta [Mycoplasmopsis cricetuli]
MILSIKHLNKYLPDISLTSSVEQDLNNLGFEVESVSAFSNVKGLKFAKVLKVYDNPNAPKLDVVELQLADQKITIQTKSKVLKQGDLTICFPEGASRGEQVFASVTLQGYPSQGMLASWSEIGYNYSLLTNKDEILVLPENFALLNEDPIVKLGLDDLIVEISPTTNRNDANSYYTIAKELGAYYGCKVEFPKLNIIPNLQTKITSTANKAQELMFFEVKGVKETTLEEKMLLAKHQIDTNFNWAVNLTNLCLIETGAPAHVYDRQKIKNNLYCDYFSGQTTILGNKEVELNNVLTIFDEEKAISLACTMGLEQTKVDLDSNTFVFEVGVFNSAAIRHNNKEIKMLSNSGMQGSRPISQEIAHRGIEFLQNNCNGLLYSSVIGKQEKLPKKAINFDFSMLKLYAGTNNIDQFKLAIKQLERLDFEFIENSILIPNYRYDIEIFPDIIEEIFRFYSYDNFKEKSIKNNPIVINEINNFKTLCSFKGYDEVKTFTLVSKTKSAFNPFEFKESIPLVTFVSKEREMIRNSIVSSLQEVIEYNQKRKLTDIDIFESGMINDNILVVGFASTTKSFEIFSKDILDLLALEVQFVPFNNNDQIHPNVSAKIMYQNKMIGWIGKLHPQFDTTDAYYAEFMHIKDKTNILKFSLVNLEPLKILDLTFELKLHEHIQKQVNLLHTQAEIFQIKQIDSFHNLKTNTKFITLRISANNKEIEKLVNIYNK